METIYPYLYVSLLLLSLSTLCAASLSFSPIDNYLINCGSAVDSIVDNRHFTGDLATSRFSCLTSSGSVTVRNEDPVPGSARIYHTARVFEKPSRYDFAIRDIGTHMVRLHFHRFNSSKFDLSRAEFHVLANEYVLLSNFSCENAVSPRVMEYLIWIDVPKLVITFSPISKCKLAYVNAIEVISAPKDLVLDTAQYVNSEKVEKYSGLSKKALEIVYRLSVGGLKVTPFNDSLWRTWMPDDDFLKSSYGSKKVHFGGRIEYQMGGASREVGPDNMYNSARVISSTNATVPNVNMTWVFPVIGGYNYLVRMHFCDIASSSIGLLYFNIYVNGYLAYKDFDLSYMTDKLASPFYADFVVDGSHLGVLNVSVGPSNISMPHAIDAILNGVEIMKMNNSVGSFDGQLSAELVLKSWPRQDVTVVVTLITVACLLLILSVITFKKTTRVKDSVAWSPLPVDISEVSLEHVKQHSQSHM